jgi:hypothetical protein
MSGDRTYASVPERITWTTGFRCATDKLVLGALSTFANFETGKGARVSLKKLCARAELKRRTVLRALQRLEADGWIVPTRRHRHATTRDIAIERLATHWLAAKIVGGVDRGFPQGAENLSVNRDAQLGVSRGAQLSVTDDPQLGDLSVNRDVQAGDLGVSRGAQALDLSVNGGTPIPSTKIRSPERTIGSPVEPNQSAPALRAGSGGTDADENPDLPPWELFNREIQSQARTTDLRADGRDHPDDVVGDGDGHRTDHPATPGAGLPLRQGPDSPGVEGTDRPRAPVGPTQPGLGLLADVNAPIAVTEDQHRRFMQELRSRVGLTSSADGEDQEKTG